MKKALIIAGAVLVLLIVVGYIGYQKVTEAKQEWINDYTTSDWATPSSNDPLLYAYGSDHITTAQGENERIDFAPYNPFNETSREQSARVTCPDNISIPLSFTSQNITAHDWKGFLAHGNTSALEPGVYNCTFSIDLGPGTVEEQIELRIEE